MPNSLFFAFAMQKYCFFLTYANFCGKITYFVINTICLIGEKLTDFYP